MFQGLWVRPRLVRRGREILADTVLIRREGGFDNLEPVEICEYVNKFFCPTFIRGEQKGLKSTGKILWSDEFAKRQIPLLEDRASHMLDVDWDRIPESHRFERGLIWDSSSMSILQEMDSVDKKPRNKT